MNKHQTFLFFPIIVIVILLISLILFSKSRQIRHETKAVSVMNGLRVVKDQILNEANQQVQMHGVNRSSFEYMCNDSTAGSANFEGPADQNEVNAMKSWNINSVRVVLNEDCWLGLHGLPYGGVTKYQQDVKNYVALLTRNNLSVIINLHFNGDGNTKATEQQPMADRAHSNDFWTSVANTFKDNSTVMFEPYNEPHDIAWSCWRDGGCTVQGTHPGDGTFVVAGMQEMINAIRATGAQNIIIATGNNFGSDLSGWVQFKPTDPLNQLVAGWHSYGDGLSCQDINCWNSTLASVLNTAPILGTEIGEFDCKHSYIDQVMNWLDLHNHQGYYGWTWGPHDCAKDPALITNWAGSPTQTFGQGFHDHLLTLP